MKRTILFFFVIFISVLIQIFPQTAGEIVCETTETTAPGSDTWGLFKPAQTASGEYFRVLIVYAQFTSDNQQDSEWPLNQLPNWANSIVATNVSSSYSEQTLSDYFDKASLGKFDFIGDVYQSLITVPTDMYYSSANQYVIGQLNNNIQDFSRYDNWKMQNGNFIFSEGNADSYLDMLIIVYRNANDSTFGIGGGIANLNISNYTTHDGIIINGGTSTIGSGITTKAGLGGKFNIVGHLAHEFGHYLFGGSHTSLGGLMMGYPYPYFGSYMMNAWERAKLGYITPTVPTTDGQQITLSDFVTTGDAIKIPIPFNNPSSTSYFLVENHKRESIYDQIMRGGSLNGNYNLTTTLGSGIYVWCITNGNNYPPNIDIKSADGAWDWQYVGDYYAGPGWYDDTDWEGYLPETIRSAVNRNTGKSDRWPSNIFWNNHWASKWVDKNPLTGQWSITRNCMGDETDAFNIGYNTLLTPWSSPSSYVNGTTNISLELVSSSGNDETVKVYSTSSSSLALPPSKPQNIKMAIVSNHPQLSWDENLEPDLAGYNIYRQENSGNITQIAYVPKAERNLYTDTEALTNLPYDNISYTIKAKDTDGLLSVSSDAVSVMAIIPEPNFGDEDKIVKENYDFSLNQNYPNPFNPSTEIKYTLKDRAFVVLKIFDVLGSEIAVLKNEYQPAGDYAVHFDASKLPSGIYFYSITAGSFRQTKKMILLR